MAKAKRIHGIECDASASYGIQLVLTGRLKEMCALRKKALDWSDPEGVHDMRVASRRLRSALRDFKPYLRKRRLKASLVEIQNLADALGRVRDEDVAIMALEKIMQKAPAEFKNGIQEFIELRRSKRGQARKALAQLLRSRTLEKLQSEFATALGESLKPPATRGTTREGAALANALTYRQVARATILNRLNEVDKLSDSLYHPLKAKPLHKMRIAVKRLRYAIELFEQCWGPPLRPFAKRMATLQTALGELHDCDVWIVEFGNRLAEAQKLRSGESSAPHLARNGALLWLLTHFVKLRTRHFSDALTRWRYWEAQNLSSQLSNSLEVGISVTAVTTAEANIATTETPGIAAESPNPAE